MADYRPVHVTPSLGGQLITKASQSEVGVANYVTKRDWRRLLDREIRREGYDYFWGNQAKVLGNQPFPNGVTAADITLVHLARRPNGKTAIIVGTKEKLWRFYANDDGQYIEDQDDYVATGYVLDLTGDWLLIGSGFSTSGHRWEASNLNGFTKFNNGVDLPVVYRLEWSEVRPDYELREAGIASVGTISEHSGIGVIGDVREMQADTMEESLSLEDSGAITASQTGATFSESVTASVALAGVTVTASAPSFALADVGKTIRFPTGFSATITVVPSNTQVTIGTPSDAAIVSERFWIANAAAFVVTASAPIFAAGDVGRSIVWDTGEVRTIKVFASPTQVTVDIDYTIASGTFAFEAENPYGPVTTFVDRIQFRFSWSLPDDPTRWGPIVPAGMVAGSTAVTLAYPLASLEAGQEITIVGAGVSGGNLTTTILAVLELGRVLRVQDAASTTVTAASTTASVQPENTTASVEAASTAVMASKAAFAETDVGRSIRFADGFQATIAAFVGEDHVTISVAPSEAITDSAFALSETGLVTRSDTVASILGYEDLQDDGSGILRMLTLDQTLIIYKDTSIFLGQYTGVLAAPWAFTKLDIPSDKTLYYRWTLVSVESDHHVYAGKNSFFRFDLTTRVPAVVIPLELVANKFFDNSKITLTDQIFGAINTITNEAWFVYPTTGTDKLIAWDYKYGSVSTSTIAITAAATVKRPTTELQTGETEDWFVMGTATATVLVYGLTDSEQTAWANKKSIFYRRSANPYNATKNGYESRLTGGLTDFGAPDREKDVDQVVFHLASQHASEPLPEPTLVANIYQTSNAARAVSLSGTMTLPKPFTENQVPTYFRDHFVQEEVVVTGIDNPAHLVAKTWMVSGIPTKNIVRRPT